MSRTGMNFDRLVVIGCGGTGSWLIPPLARIAGGRQMVLIDGDKVSDSNIVRQNFLPSEIAQNKADVLGLAVTSSQADGEPPVQTIPEFYGQANLGLVRENDLVLVCPDNHACRKAVIDRMDQLASAAAIICGNEAKDGSVTAYIRKGGRKVTLHPYDRHPEFRDTDDGDRSAMSCADLAALPGGEQTLAANFTAAALALCAATSLLSGEKWLACDVYFDIGLGMARPVVEK